jgi:hypothetical protein
MYSCYTVKWHVGEAACHCNQQVQDQGLVCVVCPRMCLLDSFSCCIVHLPKRVGLLAYCCACSRIGFRTAELVQVPVAVAAAELLGAEQKDTQATEGKWQQ